MSKVVRLNEKDIERLVRKIMSEEKKSINEGGLFDWVRDKRFSDEEIGRDVLKGIEQGEARNVRPIGGSNAEALRRVDGFEFDLADHKISAEFRRRLSSNMMPIDSYLLFVDGQNIKVSTYIVKKIMEELRNPKSKKKDLKTSLSRYNMSPKERGRLEDPNTYFDGWGS
jgi:hypothetical protein